MKIQFQIMLFMICLNLATGMAMELGNLGAVPLGDVQATNPGNSSDYESHFNATEVAKKWTWTDYGVPILGDIFSAFDIVFRTIEYVIAGFPLFLMWIGETFIVDATALLAYNIVVGTLSALFYILMFFYAIEFISGRYHSQ